MLPRMPDVDDLPLDPLDAIAPSAYAANGYPHEAWAHRPRLAVVGGIKRVPIRYRLREAA